PGTRYGVSASTTAFSCCIWLATWPGPGVFWLTISSSFSLPNSGEVASEFTWRYDASVPLPRGTNTDVNDQSLVPSTPVEKRRYGGWKTWRPETVGSSGTSQRLLAE